MTAETCRRFTRGVKLIEDYGVYVFGRKQRKELKRIAKELFYDLVDPDIYDKIDRAATETEAERFMIDCRKAM